MASFFRDLTGADPILMDLPFNHAIGADGDTITYKGAFCRIHDGSDINTGVTVVVPDGTVNQNFVGIVWEEVAATGETYLMNTAAVTGTWTRKKVLVNPHASYLVEYVQKDVDGSTETDTGYVIAASDTTTTTVAGTMTNDYLIGAWLYFVDGSNASYLHNILDNTTTQISVLRTAVTNAVAVGDAMVIVMPPMRWWWDLTATYTAFKSESITASLTNKFQGIDYWMTATGWPLQKLNPANHDGLKIANARFFHEVTHSGESATGSIFDGGLQST